MTLSLLLNAPMTGFIHAFRLTAPDDPAILWDRVFSEECATQTGVFVAADDDAWPDQTTPGTQEPQEISVSSTLAAAWFRFRWRALGGALSPYTAPVYSPSTEASSVRPSLADVAEVIPARTYYGGGQLGTFTGNTTPTAERVQGYIDKAVRDVAAVVGTDLPEQVHGQARDVAAIKAAMRIELGSEDFDQARFNGLKALYKESLDALTEAAQEALAGGNIGDVDDRATALHSFPDPQVTWLDGDSGHVPGAEDPRRW